MDKLFETNQFSDWVIQLQQRADLKYTIDLILDFNEEFNYKNEDNKDNKIENKNNKNEEEENEKLRKKYENEKKKKRNK